MGRVTVETMAVSSCHLCPSSQSVTLQLRSMIYFHGRFIFALGLKKATNRLCDKSREWKIIVANPGSHRVHFPEAIVNSESDISDCWGGQVGLDVESVRIPQKSDRKEQSPKETSSQGPMSSLLADCSWWQVWPYLPQHISSTGTLHSLSSMIVNQFQSNWVAPGGRLNPSRYPEASEESLSLKNSCLQKLSVPGTLEPGWNTSHFYQIILPTAQESSGAVPPH